jgi:hypothetical protein
VFTSWAHSQGYTDAEIGKAHRDGSWLLTPIRQRATVRVQAATAGAGARMSAAPTFCRSRAETVRIYRAINAYNLELFRIRGSLPFCVNSLDILVSSFDTFRSRLVVADWAKSLVFSRTRTRYVKSHFVKWDGYSNGAVAGRAAYAIVFEAPVSNVRTAYCPRVRIKGLGNSAVKPSGQALRYCG